MMKSEKALFLISLTIMELCAPVTLVDDKIHYLLKPPNVTIAGVSSHSVKLELSTEEPKHCYVLHYKYLDEEKPFKERELEDNHATIKLGLHSGFVARVYSILCDENHTKENNWTEITYNAPPVYIHNVSCKIYNITSLNCTWDIKQNAPNDTQYLFSLRTGSDLLDCKHYLKNQENKNIGCHMKHVCTWKKNKHRIKVQLSNYERQLVRAFTVSNIEILNSPNNICLSSQNGITKMQWKQPLSVEGELNSYCFEYQIQLLEVKKDRLFRVINTTNTEYIFSDLDKGRKYAAQIRGRRNTYCGRSKFWGEWSEMIYIGKDNEGIQTWLLLVIIIFSTTCFGISVIYLLKRYNRKIFDLDVPVPSRKLKHWMLSKEIDFQNCVADIFIESVPISEIEIVTTETNAHRQTII
ncbi:interleukin-5 receptor subunit alpha-like [Spea bombifrons]|uniref:interleukin-5 receptor subunit alpha-like n=1 Tax=Spea bombifrons TaxID=233779 RepID=UPI00234AD012|nr:interleukin-5 receptor subunit alpha-like [Spea bombifrons]